MSSDCRKKYVLLGINLTDNSVAAAMILAFSAAMLSFACRGWKQGWISATATLSVSFFAANTTLLKADIVDSRSTFSTGRDVSLPPARIMTRSYFRPSATMASSSTAISLILATDSDRTSVSSNILSSKLRTRLLPITSVLDEEENRRLTRVQWRSSQFVLKFTVLFL